MDYEQASRSDELLEQLWPEPPPFEDTLTLQNFLDIGLSGNVSSISQISLVLRSSGLTCQADSTTFKLEDRHSSFDASTRDIDDYINAIVLQTGSEYPGKDGFARRLSLSGHHMQAATRERSLSIISERIMKTTTAWRL